MPREAWRPACPAWRPCCSTWTGRSSTRTPRSGAPRGLVQRDGVAADRLGEFMRGATAAEGHPADLPRAQRRVTGRAGRPVRGSRARGRHGRRDAGSSCAAGPARGARAAVGDRDQRAARARHAPPQGGRSGCGHGRDARLRDGLQAGPGGVPARGAGAGGGILRCLVVEDPSPVSQPGARRPRVASLRESRPTCRCATSSPRRAFPGYLSPRWLALPGRLEVLADGLGHRVPGRQVLLAVGQRGFEGRDRLGVPPHAVVGGGQVGP